jgi:two-component system chemotaxis response regulator CheB
MASIPHPMRRIRVMVVDDSDAARATLVEILRSAPDVEVVLSTGDGEEGLRRAIQDRPDVVCLDLEMPRMDGFTFLRLLMGRSPTPVVVISSNSRKQDVFKALELGALDFVAKPDRTPGDLGPLRQELLAKIATVRALRLENLEPQPHDPARRVAAPPAAPALATPSPTPVPRPPVLAPAVTPVERVRPPALRQAPQGPARLVVIGASTGGPSALARLLALLPADVPLAIAIAQHMPEKFTRTFAERLDRGTPFDVREAEHGDALVAGRVLIAPGGKHLKLERVDSSRGAGLRAVVIEPGSVDRRYRPNVDLLFRSAAEAWPRDLCGVVLTGMGNDGRAGVQAVKAAGGLTIAESERSAVVYGMPKEAVESGAIDEVLSLDLIVERLVEFAGSR